MEEKQTLAVYGAGLAGCEAAWQAAKRGIKVKLYEMKPTKYTPAHHSPTFAELVCSNSLRSDSLANAVGLLKEELRQMGSLIMEAADETRVPAGSALAVDREKFSAYITEKIKNHPSIEVVCTETQSVLVQLLCSRRISLNSESLKQELESAVQYLLTGVLASFKSLPTASVDLAVQRHVFI